jgi:hypothetical protein
MMLAKCFARDSPVLKWIQEKDTGFAALRFMGPRSPRFS